MHRPFATNIGAVMGGGELATPLEIMGANLVAWWNADEAGSITTTGAGVSSWLDEIGSYDLAQATDDDRPVWSASSFNGRGGVTFDGTSDFLKIGSTPAALPIGSDTSEIWAICDQERLAADTGAGDLFNYGATSATGARRLRRVVSGGVNAVQISANGTSNTNTAVDFSGRHYLRGAFVNGAQHPDIDGNIGGDGAVVLSSTGAQVTMGASVAATGFFYDGIVHQVFILDATPDAGQLAALNAYCAARTA